MKQLDLDIFLFESILPESLSEKLYNLKARVTEYMRIELFDSNKELFYEFNKFWFDNVEEQYLNEYLKIYKPEEGIGFSAGNDAVKFLKDYLKTRWRDLFLLTYDETKMAKGIKDIHFDFSNITFIGCLNDGWEGGDLVFPRQNLRVKLKKGDIIIFPAGLTHPHYVDKVTSGHRIVIVGQSLYPEQDHKVEY